MSELPGVVYKTGRQNRGDEGPTKNGFGLFGFLVFVSFKFYGFTVGQSYVYLGSGSSMQYLFVQNFFVLRSPWFFYAYNTF